MINPWLAMGLLCVTMTAMFSGLKLFQHLANPHPEVTRKLMHVGMGLVVLSFPWVFKADWPVVALAALSAAILAGMKLIPRYRDSIGSVLTAVRRPSLGEICFPISVAALRLLCHGHVLLYVIPILILSLADAVAALVGIAYGKIRYITTDGLKSAEGSLAFLSTAFLSVHVPLLLFTDVGRAQSLLIAALIAILSMLVEAIAARGLDNLLIPLGAFAFLRLYHDATVDALMVRLIAASLLVIFVLCWRVRSTLDDSALIACALFGYGAAMLGGAPWVIGPALLFLLHVILWPRMGQHREHTVYAVVSTTLAGFFWLILQAANGAPLRFFLPYAVGFGAHLAIIGVSRIAHNPSPLPKWARLMLSIVAGWVLALIQLVPVLVHVPLSFAAVMCIPLALLAGVALAATAFFMLLPWLYRPAGSDAAIHLSGFFIALMGSLLSAVWLWTQLGYL